MLKNKRISLAVLTVLISSLTFSQNNTNSPYTRYGYGELANIGSGASKAMGGTSIGIRSNTSINPGNPASYTSIDSLTFLFEFGATGKASTFSDATGSRSTFNANIEYINMQFPITRWLAGSAGLLPYSFVGYDFSTDDSIAIKTNTGTDQINYTKTFAGTGSLNQAYIGLSGKIGKHFAVGVNASYLFGSLQSTRQISFGSESTGSYTTTTQTTILNVKDLNFRYGLQYFKPLSKTSNLIVGVILENKSELGGSYSVGISNSDTTSTKNGSAFETPLLIGGGVSYEIKNKFTIGGDLLFQNWANAKYFGVKDSLKNRIKLSLGGEYQPNLNSKSYLSRITYRFGGNITNDYLNVNNTTSTNYAITAGFGLPSKGSKSLINLGFEYGKVGRTGNKLLREDYFKFSISTAINETWFFKRRFE